MGIGDQVKDIDSAANINFEMGKSYEQEGPESLKYAIECYEKAANLGNPQAIKKYTNIFKRNFKNTYNFNQENITNIINCLKFLANSNNIEDSSYAAFELGEFYNFSLGVEEDKVLALTYYKLAKDNGHELADREIESLESKIPNLSYLVSCFLSAVNQSNVGRL